MRVILLTLVALAATAVLHGQAPAAALTPPRLVFAFELHAQVGPPMELGQVPGGRRRIVPILGGTFEGPGLRGKVLPGGADWQVVRADGFTELDTRYTIETDAGAKVYVQNAGMRHAAPAIMEKLLARADGGSGAGVLPHRAGVRDLGAGPAVDDAGYLRRDRRASAIRRHHSLLAARIAGQPPWTRTETCDVLRAVGESLGRPSTALARLPPTQWPSMPQPPPKDRLPA